MMHIYHFDASTRHPLQYRSVAQCGKRVSLRDTVSAHNPTAATCGECQRELERRIRDGVA